MRFGALCSDVATQVQSKLRRLHQIYYLQVTIVVEFTSEFGSSGATQLPQIEFFINGKTTEQPRH